MKTTLFAGMAALVSAQESEPSMLCSVCQSGCGGFSSDECWNEEHTEYVNGENVGVCDCDEDCVNLPGYQGNGVQLCKREWANCSDIGYYCGEGGCDIDYCCGTPWDFFDSKDCCHNHCSDFGDEEHAICNEQKCNMKKFDPAISEPCTVTLWEHCHEPGPNGWATLGGGSYNREALENLGVRIDGISALTFHGNPQECEITLYDGDEFDGEQHDFSAPYHDFGECKNLEWFSDRANSIRIRAGPDDCDLCIEECEYSDHYDYCHGCAGGTCKQACLAVHGEAVVDDYLNRDCKDTCESCPEGYTECSDDEGNGFCDLDGDCYGDDWCEINQKGEYDNHENCRLECDEEPIDGRHDASKCREWETHLWDDDCCGQQDSTWCADGYEKKGNDEGQTDCTYKCYPPPKECRDCSTKRGRSLLFANLPCCDYKA